jgi:hypothetical protein
MFVSSKLRARMWTRAGLAGLLAAAVLAVVPVAPASAIQTIAWTTAPPSTGTVGSQISFAWTGTANTFLGARMTGCFANYPNGGNYTSSFGGNFTVQNCSTSKLLTQVGTYPITVGFTLSTGGQMTMTWNVNVSAPTPTVHISPPSSPVVATTAHGYPMPSVSAYGSDAAYGTYAASCTPAVGTVLPVGTNTISCSATNGGGKTGTSTTSITVTKGTPTVSWSVPSSLNFGTTYGQLMTATMSPADAAGTISYTRAGGAAVAPSDVIPVGDNQAVTATYVPSGQVNAYNSVSATRSVSVLQSAQSVEFGSGTPTDKSYGDAPFEVTATGTSGGGNVSITPEAGSACTVDQTATGTSAAASVTLTGAGACVLLANQAASGQYTAAPTAQASVTVAKRTSTIAWAPSATQTYGEPLADLLTATADAPGTIDYTVNGDPVTASTVLEAGADQSVVATFTPTTPGNHTGAVATLVLSVLQAPQALHLAPIADTTYGVAPFDLDVSGSGPGTVSAEATGSCTVSGTTVTVTTSGDCTVTVSKAATANHLAATPVSRTFSVSKAVADLTWQTPAGIAYGTPLGDAQLDAEVDGAGDPAGTVEYTLADGTSAVGKVLPVGQHELTATWTPIDPGWKPATTSVTITVSPQPDTADTLGPEAQHQVDEQRVEAQADLSAGETRTFSVTCPGGYFASDGSGRVDAVDQGTGTLADVVVRESHSSSLDTWTVTMANHATGRAQGKVFADCVQRETAEVDGHRHALVLDQAATETRNLTGPTTITVACADGRSPVAPGFQLDGDAVVRRSAADGTSAWTFEVVPSGTTTGTFSARCLDDRVSRVSGHDHRLDLRQVAAHVTVGAGQVVEAQTTCGDLARGIVGGWSLEDGLVLTGAEPRAKTRATRLFNPTSGPLSADLTLQCLETRTAGGSSSTAPVAPSVAPQVVVPATVLSLKPQGSVAAPSSRAVTVTARGRVAANVSCGSGETTCTGTAKLVALRTQRVAGKVLRKGTVLASATYVVAAGSVDRVVLRSTRRGQRVLPAAGLRRAQLRVGDQVRTVSLRR